MIYLRLIRWPNLFIMAFTMMLVRYKLILPQLRQAGIEVATSANTFIFLVISVLLIAAGGFVINDIMDLNADKINKPKKQFVGKGISVSLALNLYWTLTGAAILCSIYAGYMVQNWRISFVIVIMAGLMWFYSKRYKKMLLLGNIVVAFASAMVLLIVWLAEFFALQSDAFTFTNASPVFPMITGMVMAYTFFAFLSSIVRELVKDTEDMDGDAQFGIQSFPIVYGEANAKNTAIGLMAILLLMIGFWQFILFQQDYYNAFLSMFVAATFCVLAIIRLATAAKIKHYGQTSFILKLLMVSGISSMLFL
ncbi:MAG: geranylgeranylglycerol-phosphate geranylgeranyltransferase [Bacteroidetes bacterium]|nr:geranylgeranylglycerol-phosphate geranylgeranyltransferase [Bacteroidota bacterium]